MCDVSRKRCEHRKCAFQHPLLVAFWFKADAGFAESSWIIQVALDWTFRWPVWALTVFPLNWRSFFPATSAGKLTISMLKGPSTMVVASCITRFAMMLTKWQVLAFWQRVSDVKVPA
ncbi:unnamed protein product [Effrenium voratum]|uniref:Uncharacterized protein n=1 Tax=Effrenium voratum TaxID=2562239 RepID=A0AA36JKU0_9DINO|nr:unnamed protein product [Effrenium voratum]CAJ1431335.1 unnamed protein product [Effrenium voratum]